MVEINTDAETPRDSDPGTCILHTDASENSGSNVATPVVKVPIVFDLVSEGTSCQDERSSVDAMSFMSVAGTRTTDDCILPNTCHSKVSVCGSDVSAQSCDAQSPMFRRFLDSIQLSRRSFARQKAASQATKNDPSRASSRFGIRGSFARLRASFRNLSFVLRSADGVMVTVGSSNNTSTASTAKQHCQQDQQFRFDVSAQTFCEFANLKMDTGKRYAAKLDLADTSEVKHVLQTGSERQIKKLLRQNAWSLHNRIRLNLWRMLCFERCSMGSTSFEANKTLYSETIALLPSSLIDIDQVALAKNSIVIRSHFQLNDKGQAALCRVLAVIEHLRPDITCVPILYSLTTLFLLFYAEDVAFSCIFKLLSTAQKFLMQTEISYTASKCTLLMLVKEHIPAVYSLLRHSSDYKKDKGSISRAFDDWSLWLFKYLPLPHVVRIVDCFLFEGQKVLFRSALAILILWNNSRRKRFLRKFSTADTIVFSLDVFVSDVASFCRLFAATPTVLLNTAFAVRNLKWSHIRQTQQQYEMEVRSTTCISVPSVPSNETKRIDLPSLPSCAHISEFRMVSSILSQEQTKLLLYWLPARIQLLPTKKIFNMAEDGISFTTFWLHVNGSAPTVTVIESDRTDVFGAYCSAKWSQRLRCDASSFFGTGETFLFVAKSDGGIEKYDWVGLKHGGAVSHNQELFMSADATNLVVGGGSGSAIRIFGSLEKGSSERCDTFENPPLACSRDFCIRNLEVFTFGTSDCDEE